MTVESLRLARRDSALRLWDWLIRTHWNREAIAGPDPIGKLNWRLWRFVKAYLPQYPWKDSYVYEQAQGYWVRANLGLHRWLDDDKYLVVARKTADGLVRRQRPDGAWNYPPLRERQHRLSTVEGTWAALGLAAAYRRLGRSEYLQAALKWRHFVEETVGLLPAGGGLSVRYYKGTPGIIPNVSTMYLWLLAELEDLTGDHRLRDVARRLVDFLIHSQLDSGELPYEIPNRPHFMCYQYNSFQFLDVVGYWLLTGDPDVKPLLHNLASYLSGGPAPSGAARYSCTKETPEVNYWTSALGAALHVAQTFNLLISPTTPGRAFDRLLGRQNPDGSLGYSTRNYGLLEDRRSYPRPQVMALAHLIIWEDPFAWFASSEEPVPVFLAPSENNHGRAPAV